MPAVSLNQRSGVLPAVSGSREVLFRLSLSFCFRPCAAVQFFGFPQRLLSERELLSVLGLSFYPLEQAPNIVIYAMSKSGTATSGLIYLFGFFSPMHRHRRAPLLPKNSSAH